MTMTSLLEPLHVLVRNSRRAHGVWQTRDELDVDGTMPLAVVAAVKRALRGQSTADERRWIERIEALRGFLLLSPTEFDMTDFGAGPRSAPAASASTTTSTSTTRTIGHMTLSSKPRRWAELLFQLVRATQVTSLLELGSCVGISAAYQAAALELNGAGRLISLEGVAALSERSQRSIDELGLSERAQVRLGEFGTTLPAAIADLEPIDYAFIDGNHNEQATLAYAEQLHDHLADEAIVIFDDINWSDGMTRAWRAVVDDPRYAVTIDLRSVGIALVSASATGHRHLEIAYF